MNQEIELNEKELEDSYPVYMSYLYVCDDKVIRSDIEGTVKDLKKDLRGYYKLEAKVIKNCDIAGRQKLLKREIDNDIKSNS